MWFLNSFFMKSNSLPLDRDVLDLKWTQSMVGGAEPNPFTPGFLSLNTHATKKKVQWIVHSMSVSVLTLFWATSTITVWLAELSSEFLLRETVSQKLHCTSFLNKQRIRPHLLTHLWVVFTLLLHVVLYESKKKKKACLTLKIPFFLSAFLSCRSEGKWFGSLGPRPNFEQAHYQP